MIISVETTLTSLARLMVSLLVAFSFPLQAHPARRCLMTLVAQVLDGPAPGPTPGPSSTSMFRPSDTDADTDFVTSIRSSAHAYSISNTHTAQDRVVCVRYWAVTVGCSVYLCVVIVLLTSHHIASHLFPNPNPLCAGRYASWCCPWLSV